VVLQHNVLIVVLRSHNFERRYQALQHPFCFSILVTKKRVKNERPCLSQKEPQSY
jgi:hypothetical protein